MIHNKDRLNYCEAKQKVTKLTTDSSHAQVIQRTSNFRRNSSRPNDKRIKLNPKNTHEYQPQQMQQQPSQETKQRTSKTKH